MFRKLQKKHSHTGYGIVAREMLPRAFSPGPTWSVIVPIVNDRDKCSNRGQSQTNRNDENVMCDYLSEYLRMCFRLYEDSS